MHEDSKESAIELRMRQSNRYVSLAIVAILALCALLFVHVETIKQSEAIAQQNQQTQAKITIDSDVCKVYPDQELCVLARKIAANPGEAVIPKDGKDGAPGETGRGVASFSTSAAGELVVIYSDGQSQSLGRVVGKDGINGKDGRGVLATSVENGSLVVRYTDGSTENLGIVTGPKGADGQSVTGPTGPAGADGISVTNISVDTAGTVVVYYSNGTSATAGTVIVNTIKSMTCQNNTLTITTTDDKSFSAPVLCSTTTITTK